MAIPSLIIKRISGGDYLIDDIGIVVPNASQTEITDLQDVRNALCSANLHAAAVAADLVLNDGTRDIPAAEISCFMRRFDTGHVDDVATYTDLPGTGIERQIYLVADEHATYQWNGSGWTQTCIDQKRLGGIIVAKFGNSAPSEYKHPSGAAVSTYERFQSGKNNASGAGFAGASREWIAGGGGDAGGGDYDGGAGGDLVARPGGGGAGSGTGSEGARGRFVIYQSGIKNVSTDGLLLENETPATVGMTVQMSPRMRLRGHAMRTGAGEATQTHDWIAEVLPTTMAGTDTTSQFRLGKSVAGGAYAFPLIIDSRNWVTVSTIYATGLRCSLIHPSGGNDTLVLQDRPFTFADSAIEAVAGTMTQGDGMTFIGLHIRPTYAQSGTASGVDFLVSRKENSVGTGPQLFMDLGTCTTAGDYTTHTSKFSVTNTGVTEIGNALKVWHAAKASNDFVNLYHTSADGVLNTQSGTWQIHTAGVVRFYVTGTAISSATANGRDLGATTLEWRAVYAGQGTLSGLYIGSSQEGRLWYDNGNSRTEFTSSNMFTINAEFNMRSGKKLSLGDGGAATDLGMWFNGAGAELDLKTGNFEYQHGAVTKWIWNASELYALDDHYFSLGTGGYAADWYAKYTGTNCEMKIVAGEWQFYGGASEIYVINSSGEHGWFGVTPVAQQGHIDDASGGTTVDDEARTAINSLLAAIENYGLLAAA